MDVFKKNGCPYLVEIKSADIAAPTVTLPDGTIAQDTLVWKRVTLQYSTTDGFNVNQYNHENTIIVDGVPSLDLFIEKLETMYDLETIMGVGYDENNRIGYDGFVKSMKEIDALDTEAVKINSISAKDEGGYLVLTAEIDFYSATFNSRLSKDENTEPYVVYPDAADKAIKIGHGFIGMPYIVTDTQSAWYNIMVADNLAASSMKPFSTYYSKALFEQLVQAQGLARTLGVEIERPISISDVPTVPPEVADAYSAGLTEGDDATGGLNNE